MNSRNPCARMAVALALCLATPVLADDPALIRIEAAGKALEIPASGVAAVTPGGMQIAPEIRVRLTETYDAPFATLTEGAVGSEVVILVCGLEVSRATLREPLSRADFVLALPDTVVARAILDQLRRKSCGPV
jgi:hypothetical protein